MKYSELVKLIENDGWCLDRMKGSHRQYEHPTKMGIVTVAYHSPSDDVPKGMLNRILKDAGLKKGK